MRHNILLITADDMGGDTPGCFGGPAGVTPALDGLAAESMTFGRAHVAVAVCQPSRSAIMTGRWPHRNGAQGFEPIAEGVPLLTQVLREAGYRSGILGKVDHLQPVEAFGWDLIRGMRDLGMGRDPAAYGAAAASFMAQAPGPWFLMANAHDPHRPYSGSDDELARFPEEARATYPAPSKVFGPQDDVGDVPGFLPDLPEVAREYREYLSSSRRCDDVVAEVLRALEESGSADDTVVVFLSDNGIAVPFAKANCYLQSSRTPLILRWPGRTTPGCREETAFVSAIDLFPTLCEAAGVTPPPGVDGRSILPLLEGLHQDGRDEVFTVFHETAMKARFEMRCRQDARYGYIWNAWSDGDREYRAENMMGRTWPAMIEASAEDERLAGRTRFYVTRAPEELYDLETDPHSLVNLAEDPAHRKEIEAVREDLRRWMARTGDPLLGTYERLLHSGVDES